jgi:preprotein translocase subunit YajC
VNDGPVLILFLLVALALLWFFVWGPKAKEARAERERREAEDRARRG